MKDDAFYAGASLYNHPQDEYERTLPADTIPGWEIQLRVTRQFPDQDSRVFFFHAFRGEGTIDHTCFDIERVVSNTLWEIGDRSTIISEVVKVGIKELRVSITKWMVENDEACRTLQRVLDYGLSGV